MRDRGNERKILFISTNYSSFVKQDAETLEKHYKVERFEFGAKKGMAMIAFQLRLLFWIIANIRRSELIFIWFADYHSFLPILLSKIIGIDSFLIVGGYDAAKLQIYNYGGHLKPLRSWLIRKSCEWATKVLPVSDFVNNELSKNIGTINLSKRIVVYNGIDVDLFQHEEVTKEFRSGIVCVSSAESIDRLKVKGLDLLMAVARNLPNESFTIIGVHGDAMAELSEQKLPNVTLIGRVSRESLENIFRKSKIVCQFSRYESFGMALAEGMLCGCIAVTVSGIGAVEIVDEFSGVVADSFNIDCLTKAVEKGLQFPEEARIQAVHRIENFFSLQRRSQLLLAIISKENPIQ